MGSKPAAKPSPLEVKNAILAFFADLKYVVVITVAELDNPRHFGEADFQRGCINVNPRRGNLFKVVETLVHEAAHLLHPEWTHHLLNHYEREIMGLLTNAEREWILTRAMTAAAWRD